MVFDWTPLALINGMPMAVMIYARALELLPLPTGGRASRT